MKFQVLGFAHDWWEKSFFDQEIGSPHPLWFPVVCDSGVALLGILVDGGLAWIYSPCFGILFFRALGLSFTQRSVDLNLLTFRCVLVALDFG